MDGSSTVVGTANKLAVLAALRERGPASIRELALLTGVSQPTATKWLAELRREGWVAKQGIGTPTTGRPPSLFALNPDATYSVGLYVEIPLVRIAAVNLAGRAIASDSWTIAVEQEPERILGGIAERAKLFLGTLPIETRRINCLGVAFSGFIDQNQGLSVHSPRIPNWRDVPVRSYFQESLRLPTYLLHTIDASVMAEAGASSEPFKGHCLYFNVTHGIGVRLVVDGEPVAGQFGNAGLIGHTTVVPDGLQCVCGNRGCLEMYASNRALVREIKDALRQEPDSPLAQVRPDGTIDIPQLISVAESGDTSATEIVGRLVEFLSIGVANSVNLFEVSRVILGGLVTQAGEPFRARLLEAAKRRLQPPLSDRLTLTYPRVSSSVAGPVGAGLFAMRRSYPFLANSSKVPAPSHTSWSRYG